MAGMSFLANEWGEFARAIRQPIFGYYSSNSRRRCVSLLLIADKRPQRLAPHRWSRLGTLLPISPATSDCLAAAIFNI